MLPYEIDRDNSQGFRGYKQELEQENVHFSIIDPTSFHPLHFSIISNISLPAYDPDVG